MVKKFGSSINISNAKIRENNKRRFYLGGMSLSGKICWLVLYILFIIQAEKFLNADWLKRALFISNTCQVWKKVVFQEFGLPYLEESGI